MLVLFDIGSTLLEGPPNGPSSRLADAFGLPPSQSGLLSNLIFQRPHSTPADLAKILAHEFSLPLARVLEAVTSLWAAQIEEAYPLPGAHRVLSTILGSGHTVAFVSNIWQPFLDAFCRHFPEAYHSCRGYYSFRMGVSKPDTSIFQAALNDFGASPRATVVIGDTYDNDIRPGIALGMHAIWVLHRPDKERANIVRVLNGRDPRPALTIDTISQLTTQQIDLLQDQRFGR